MSIEIYEMAKSPSTTTGRSASARVIYFARGSDYEPDIRAAFLIYLANIAPTYDGLILLSTDHQPLGAGVWNLTAAYGMREKPASSDGGGDTNGGDQIGTHVRVSFGVRTQHITQSLRTVDAKGKAADARGISNHKGAIGVDKTGVQGCDIPVPNLTWTETWTFIPRFLTWDYVKTLRDLTGRTNLTSFRSHSHGEVMFLGGDVSQDDPNKATINFNFFAEENITKFQLTPEFNAIDKEGHQYFWVEYEDDVEKVNAADRNYIRTPRAVYVEEVGRPGGSLDGGEPSNKADFALLRIGR